MKKIILASKSKVRIKILNNSGINFDFVYSNVNEYEIKKKCLIEKLDAESTALNLAKSKAEKVSLKYKENYVIGADQILECDNILFNKAENFEEAYKNLLFFKNKKHYLVNGISIFINGSNVWNFTNKISMIMRDFSDKFLRNYLSNNKEVINSVGCYFIENEGIQLFSEIDNDYFSILGMPLIPVLNFLRKEGIIDK